MSPQRRIDIAQAGTADQIVQRPGDEFFARMFAQRFHGVDRDPAALSGGSQEVVGDDDKGRAHQQKQDDHADHEQQRDATPPVDFSNIHHVVTHGGKKSVGGCDGSGGETSCFSVDSYSVDSIGTRFNRQLTFVHIHDIGQINGID